MAVILLSSKVSNTIYGDPKYLYIGFVAPAWALLVYVGHRFHLMQLIFMVRSRRLSVFGLYMYVILVSTYVVIIYDDSFEF